MLLNRNFIRIPLIISLFTGAAFFTSNCGNDEEAETKTDSVSDPWLNHSDSAHYVGMQTCRKCHEDIYSTFIETGMGKSFDHATLKKSSGKFGTKSTIYDKFRDMWYHSYFEDSALYIAEFRLKGKDTIYKHVEKADYIIGSGQHTNSHMYSVNGYVYQMPMTFYTQKGEWDLPPGFENGYNSRYSRQIGLECMSCHNSLPGFVEGSENKYDSIPNGIGCERCHGPGSIHVAMKQAGIMVDTSKYIDYSIVNPGKLSPDRQFDVCQRCHLQGNAVLHEGKSFYDFRPGMRLSDYITVFMPKYSGAENDFIMASHAERLKMSQCFIQTRANNTDTSGLRPYKNAFTCVTCHNPHVSVKETSDEHFNAACVNCHKSGGKSTLVKCSDDQTLIDAANNNCVSCHMPRTGAIDIPHVSVHDHFIRKSYIVDTTMLISKKFLGLFAVNDPAPSAKIKALAYLQQYEKFGKDKQFLDSASHYLPQTSVTDVRTNIRELVHLAFLYEDVMQIKRYVDRAGVKYLLDTVLTKTSFDNYDAWTAYRIGEGYSKLGDNTTAEMFYKKSADLAPYHPDFRSKYAFCLAEQNKNFEARAQYQMVVDENPKYVPALTNLGYLWLMEHDDAKAEAYYKMALANDPDDEQALLNMVGLYLYRNDYVNAKKYYEDCASKHPDSKQVQALKQIIANP